MTDNDIDNDPQQTTAAGDDTTGDLASALKSLLGSMEKYTKSMEKFLGIHKELVDFGEKSLEQDEEFVKLHEKAPDVPVWILALIKMALAKGEDSQKVVCEFVNRHEEAQEGVIQFVELAKAAHIGNERTDDKV